MSSRSTSSQAQWAIIEWIYFPQGISVSPRGKPVAREKNSRLTDRTVCALRVVPVSRSEFAQRIDDVFVGDADQGWRRKRSWDKGVDRFSRLRRRGRMIRGSHERFL